MNEVEVRAIVPEELLQDAKEKILSMGFVPSDEIRQLDIIFDKKDAELFRSGQKIRMRLENDNAELTYKGHFKGDSTASRRIETNIPIDIRYTDQVILFLEALGFPKCFQINKTRKNYTIDNVRITFDTWPIIGCMVEFEGREEIIKEFANIIFPNIIFKNLLLKEAFENVQKERALSLSELKAEYEKRTGNKLGNIELLMI
jgi:predicted adenylyl cyclase CyaB